jgi:hypothetical protein
MNYVQMWRRDLSHELFLVQSRMLNSAIAVERVSASALNYVCNGYGALLTSH